MIFLISVVLLTGCLEQGDHQNQSFNKTQKQEETSDQQVKKAFDDSARRVENSEKKGDKKPTTEDRIVEEISDNTYSWYEEGSTATLTFQRESNSNTGTLVLTGTIHILEFRIEGDRNAVDAVANPNIICRFEYTYDIRGNYIHVKFVKSTCDYHAADRTFTFNESNNSISIYSNEGEMIFK